MMTEAIPTRCKLGIFDLLKRFCVWFSLTKCFPWTLKRISARDWRTRACKFDLSSCLISGKPSHWKLSIVSDTRMIILCTTSPLELNYIVLRWRCKNIVSLGIKKVHDLTIDTSPREVDGRIEAKAVQLILVNDPLLIERELWLQQRELALLLFLVLLRNPSFGRSILFSLYDSFSPYQWSIFELRLLWVSQLLLVGDHSDGFGELL